MPRILFWQTKKTESGVSPPLSHQPTNTLDETQQLRGTLAWMDLVLANVDEYIFIVNKDWQVVFINDTLAQLIGQEKVLSLGKLFWELIPLKWQGKSITEIFDFTKSPLKESEKLAGVYRLDVFKTNRLLNVVPNYIGNLEQVVFVMGDISIEVRAVETLKQKDEEIAQLKKQLNSK